MGELKLVEPVHKEDLERLAKESQKSLTEIKMSLESILNEIDRSEDAIIAVTKNSYLSLQTQPSEAKHKIWENRVVIIATFFISCVVLAFVIAFFIRFLEL